MNRNSRFSDAVMQDSPGTLGVFPGLVPCHKSGEPLRDVCGFCLAKGTLELSVGKFPAADGRNVDSRCRACRPERQPGPFTGDDRSFGRHLINLSPRHCETPQCPFA